MATVKQGAGRLWLKQLNEELDARLTDAPSNGSEYVRKDGDWAVATGGGGGVDTSGTPAANDFARFTDADTIEGRSYAEVKADLGLVIGTNVQAYDANMISWPASVDATEVGYLNGVTSAIQTQLNGKAIHSLMKAKGNTSAASIANTSADITWAAASISSSDVSVSGVDLTINTTGTYKFTVTLRTDNDNRTELLIKTFFDTGSGYAQDTDAIVSNYVSRDIDQDTGGITLIDVFELESGDKVKFQGEGDCDGTCTMRDAGTAVIVERVA